MHVRVGDRLILVPPGVGLLTGDDGRIAIVGRQKDLIISGGFNIYPEMIFVDTLIILKWVRRLSGRLLF